MTRDAPWMRPYIWFKTHHLFTEKYEATGRMLTEPFLIVGEDGLTDYIFVGTITFRHFEKEVA